MFLPSNDGVDHINVYSKGRTALGRWLSNFAFSPIVTEDGPFNSIEGYWYWLSVRDDVLRGLHGYEAKRVGRSLRGSDWVAGLEFREKIKRALTVKMETYPDRLAEFQACSLPITHYYVSLANISVPVSEAGWILFHLNTFRVLPTDVPESLFD